MCSGQVRTQRRDRLLLEIEHAAQLGALGFGLLQPPTQPRNIWRVVGACGGVLGGHLWRVLARGLWRAWRVLWRLPQGVEPRPLRPLDRFGLQPAGRDKAAYLGLRDAEPACSLGSSETFGGHAESVGRHRTRRYGAMARW